MLQVFAHVLHRDLQVAWRHRSDVWTALTFFAVVVSLFPLAVGPERETLQAIAPGILWVTALLSSTLSLPGLFAMDHADGTLEQLLLSPQPLTVIVLGKLLAHWVVSGLPLVLLSPLLALQFDLPASAIGVLVASLVLGTPVLSLLGGIAAALTLGVRGGSILLNLLVLPLLVPVLIFGAGAVSSHASGLGFAAHLELLGAVLALSLALAPWLIAQALRLSVA
jgi:heme exporter protein B